MTTSPIDALARQAAAVHNRRASLTALGATLLAAAATAPFAAMTSAKKKKSKVSKDVKKVCAKQVGFCKTGWTTACGDSETCVALAGCCDFLRTCDAAAQVKCMTDIL
jgi:hypothetical protein